MRATGSGRCRLRLWQYGIAMSAAREQPVAVFDSGVGGLTVLREMRHQLPTERLLYVADLAHFPYGPRPQRQVRSLALDIIGMLVAMDTKLVVVACKRLPEKAFFGR